MQGPGSSTDINKAQYKLLLPVTQYFCTWGNALFVGFSHILKCYPIKLTTY